MSASRLAPRHPSLWAGLLILLPVLAPATLSVVWTPFPPGAIDVAHRLQNPSIVHPLGTDAFGRDVTSVLMVASLNSVLVCAAAVCVGALVGIPLGLLGGSGGWGGALALRIADLALAFPPVLTAAMLVAAQGTGVGSEIVAIAVFNVPAFVRVTRAGARQVLGRDFVAAARVAGRGRVAVLSGHVLPNTAAILLVQGTLALAIAVLSEAGLSYLGLGLPPPLPSLGRTLAEDQARIFDAPLLVVAPGAAVALLVLGCNLLGDGLRDRLDPTLAPAS